ncbi:hypothetical protein CANARDRAFT_6802 [[Candida] arabinofermentans NRRL YB-2248]|uniref:TAP42-like protein n=1 Tax=[Candida] arabinofermentans NRRL YB-2248 TaxID=983967 RepID=A0A1E4T3I6_9ASCO|nr:hypothetical protein CANARDRAFT_6802 [[Candida] arabinofermentans NRRL YB-2248]
MSSAEVNIPLSKRYSDALKSLSNLQNSPYRKDSKEFQNQLSETLNELKNVKSTLNQLSLFSMNESLDEVDTRYIKYLAMDYHLAQAMENGGMSPSGGGPKARLANLKLVDSMYLQFLYTLDNYGVLSEAQSKMLDSFENAYDPKLDEVRVKDGVRRREAKIESYKLEKELEAKVKIIEDENAWENLDDEVVRAVYVDQLKLLALKAFGNLEGNLLECEVLSGMPDMSSFHKVEEIKSDDRENNKKSNRFDEGYTDKLESLTKPVLSKEGKVLRPFTIVSSNSTRDKLRQKVQGTGQYLPTMSVEELIDYELKNGGMVADELPEKEFDEDDEVDVDRLTYSKREWDEFAEANRKGSGNTQNLG